MSVDPDNLNLCRSCLHDVRHHGLDGCAAVDNLGNRCACEQQP